MRRIISQLFVLLDGVMKAPEEWHFPYDDTWMAEVVAEQIDGADILLLGRGDLSDLRGVLAAAGRRGAAGHPDQRNAEAGGLGHADVRGVAEHHGDRGRRAEELAKIKEQPGRNVTVSGGPTLVRSLLRNCLLDKLPLLVHPLVRGHGRRWLEDGLAQPLELIGSRPARATM